MKSAARLLVCLLALSLPGPAGASVPLDPVQTEAALRGVELRRSELAAELDALARRIEARKTATRGSVLPDGELLGLLQRSQALADQLVALQREEDAARARHRRALEARLLEQERVLDRLRATAGAPSIAVAEAERNRLRREIEALSPGKAGVVGLPAGTADDPDEVREQADLLRDQRDRVLAQLARVEERIDEAREEEILARELRDFVEEADLFDDGERVMRRTVTRGVGSDAGPGPVRGDGGRPPPTHAPAENDDLDSGGAGGPAGPVIAPGPSSLRIVGTRPLGAGDPAGRRIPSLDGDESVAELLEQQRSLLDLAGELERRAEELDRRARQLADPVAR